MGYAPWPVRRCFASSDSMLALDSLLLLLVLLLLLLQLLLLLFCQHHYKLPLCYKLLTFELYDHGVLAQHRHH